MTRSLGLLALLVLAIAAAFTPVWWRGDSLMAALGAPGITERGPVGVGAQDPVPQMPVADAVAAFIDEPEAALYAAQRAEGIAPLWNPHNGLGVPLFGNWQSSIPSPLRLLVDTWPRQAWAFDVTYLLRLLVAGAGALLLALRLRLGGTAALAVGLTFGLCGYFVRYLPMHHLNGEVWLPWLWLAADVLARGPTLRALLGYVFVVYCVVVGGNPQPVLATALATAVFCGWRLRGGGTEAPAWQLSGLLRVALAALPPLLLASSYWLAGLEYVSQAVHHHSAKFGADAYTLAGALGMLLPEPFARPGGPPYYAVVAPYFGVLPVLLALLGLGRGLGRSVWLWALLVAAAGKIAGLWGLGWIGELPGLSMMKIFKYLYPPATLALALLCGGGVAALAAARPSPRRLRWVAAAVAVILGVPLAAGLWASSSHAYLDFAGWRQLLLAVALLAGTLLAAARSGRAAAPIAVGLLALELVSATPSHWLPRRPPWQAPGFLAAMPHDEPGRFRTFGAYGMWMPNQNAVFGIDDVRLHDGVFPARFGPFVKRFLDPGVRHWPVFTGEDLGLRSASEIRDGLELANLLLPQGVAQDVRPIEFVNLFAPTPGRYLDLVNVRYLVLPAKAAPTAAALMTKTGCEQVYLDQSAVVIERPSALARAFFPARVEAVASMEQAYDRMAAPDWKPDAVAYLETSLGERPAEGHAGVARVTAERGGELELSLQTARDAWLVVSVYPYPGMTARLQGLRGGEPAAAAELVPADGTLSAVRVPRGRWKLTIDYRPTWRSPAHWLQGIGAAGLLALALWLLRDRRRSAPDAPERPLLANSPG